MLGRAVKGVENYEMLLQLTEVVDRGGIIINHCPSASDSIN
jgi:hypothetical protein